MDQLTDRERDVLRQALHEWLYSPVLAPLSRDYVGDMPYPMVRSTALDLLARLSYARA